ncbi:MAG: class I SAM-dependent methyltransferase [Candidatus Gracilibacteria bacterium]|nr:class I SAM-dependent methyltransferase [Candidatus Gracilibacteria bacterium]
MTSTERQSPETIESAEITHAARYHFAKKFLKSDQITLDAPCGTGYGTSIITQIGAKCRGIDISKDAINHANTFFSNDLNDFLVGNIEKINNYFNDRFDAVISFEGIEHISNQEDFLDGVKKILKKNGVLIISTPRKPHGNPFHIKELELEEFVNLLNYRFKVISIYTQAFTDFQPYDERKDYSIYKKLNYIAICRKK